MTRIPIPKCQRCGYEIRTARSTNTHFCRACRHARDLERNKAYKLRLKEEASK